MRRFTAAGQLLAYALWAVAKVLGWFLTGAVRATLAAVRFPWARGRGPFGAAPPLREQVGQFSLKVAAALAWWAGTAAVIEGVLAAAHYYFQYA